MVPETGTTPVAAGPELMVVPALLLCACGVDVCRFKHCLCQVGTHGLLSHAKPAAKRCWAPAARWSADTTAHAATVDAATVAAAVPHNTESMQRKASPLPTKNMGRSEQYQLDLGACISSHSSTTRGAEGRSPYIRTHAEERTMPAAATHTHHRSVSPRPQRPS